MYRGAIYVRALQGWKETMGLHLQRRRAIARELDALPTGSVTASRDRRGLGKDLSQPRVRK
jgi:hypothetical protein